MHPLVKHANDLLATRHEIEAEVVRYYGGPRHAELVRRLCRVDDDWQKAYADALAAIRDEAGLLP
jgi:hypothetical protein